MSFPVGPTGPTICSQWDTNVSIDELEENGAVLDDEWKPCTYKEAKRKICDE